MNCLHVPRIMMPCAGTDLYKWSVIACDQYTSQPEYWAETDRNVGSAPSTLHLTLPEVYLGGADEAERVKEIHRTMERYLLDGTLQEMQEGFMLVERGFGKEYSRCGLVVEIDLETYEYKKGAHSLTRPTEMTVEERIPPRLRVRQTASVELPHIMLLIDDPEREIIEPLMARKGEFEKVYDTDLMQEGGHVSGWLIPKGKETQEIMEKVELLAEPSAFRERYGLEEDYPILNFAVGDGNHSMATAKAAWENIKKSLNEKEQQNHPARFCLCEIVNVHDESLVVEPIHRVVFQVREEELLAAARNFYEEKGCQLVVTEKTAMSPLEKDHKSVKDRAVLTASKTDGESGAELEIAVGKEEAHCFTLCSSKGWKNVKVINPQWGIAVATLQAFLDDFLAKHSESKIDYIHGDDVVAKLGTQEGNLGFFLPEIQKEDLFIGVIKDGVLPRKTFSMGEANEKRYYMECKRIGII